MHMNWGWKKNVRHAIEDSFEDFLPKYPSTAKKKASLRKAVNPRQQENLLDYEPVESIKYAKNLRSQPYAILETSTSHPIFWELKSLGYYAA